MRERSRRLLAELSSTENPLWAEHKLRLYEEQELTMNVFGENNEAQQEMPPVSYITVHLIRNVFLQSRDTLQTKLTAVVPNHTEQLLS